MRKRREEKIPNYFKNCNKYIDFVYPGDLENISTKSRLIGFEFEKIPPTYFPLITAMANAFHCVVVSRVGVYGNTVREVLEIYSPNRKAGRDLSRALYDILHILQKHRRWVRWYKTKKNKPLIRKYREAGKKHNLTHASVYSSQKWREQVILFTKVFESLTTKDRSTISQVRDAVLLQIKLDHRRNLMKIHEHKKSLVFAKIPKTMFKPNKVFNP